MSWFLQNDKLKEEQEVLIQNLLRQAKDADKLFNEEDIKEKDHVILAMKEMWDKQRERERRIEGVVNLPKFLFLSSNKILVRPNKKISVFRVMGLKILGRVGTHIFF